MERDVQMENGYDSDYPEPYADSPTPYPTLSRGSGANKHRSQIANGRGPGSATISTRNPAPVFTTLADYLNIGNINNDRLRISVEPEVQDQSDDEDDGDADQNAAPRQNDVSNATENGAAHESDGNESSSSHSPWTTSFFTRYGSGSPQPDVTPLPGFHALPEMDTYYTPLRPGQPNSYPGSVQTSRYGSGESAPSTPQRRGRGRTPRGSKRGSGRGSRGWKKMIEKTEHAELFKKPRLPRDPTTGRRGRKKGRPTRKHIDPGPEYKAAAAAANQAFFAEDYDAALEHIFEAIQFNPEVYHGHLLFSEILDKQGRVRDALYAITNGAAIKRDPQVWVQVAERYLALEEKDQDPNDVVSALKCYMEAVKLDPDNCEMREGKLKLLLELEHWKAARLECKALVRIRPAELDYVRQYASLCSISGKHEDRERALEAYGTAFKLLEAQSSMERPEEQWDHLNVYLDLLLRNNRTHQGLREAKRIARWFLGRKDDIFWNAWDTDDREFDIENSRRVLVVHFQQGLVSRNPNHYGNGLPLDIRVKLGMFRTRMGLLHQPEAMNHLSHLRQLSAEVQNFSDMFFDVAECLRKSGFPQTAITFYEPIKAHPELVDEEFSMGLAQSYERVGRTEDAEESFLKVIELSPSHVEGHMALLKLYRATDQKVKAHAMATEVVRLGYEGLLVKEKIRVPRQKVPERQKGTGKTSHPSKKMRLLASKPSDSALQDTENDTELDSYNTPDADNGELDLRADTNQAQRLYRRRVKVETNYTKVKELWKSLESPQDPDGRQQWIQHASALAKTFRDIQEFFPTPDQNKTSRDKFFTHLKDGARMQGSAKTKEMIALQHQLANSAIDESEAMAMRSIEGGAPSEFQGITFAEWHRILSTLAIAYAENVAQDKCYDMLQNVLVRANVFQHNATLHETTLAVCICCALMFNDSRLMTETARLWQFPGIHASTKTTHLVAAFGRLSHGEAFFYHRNTQSWAQFAVKEQDFLAMSPEMRAKVDWGDNWIRLHERAKRNDDGSSKNDLDAGLLATHAHILGSKQGGAAKAGSSSLALSYLFRALALQPSNVVVNLSIAITYLALSMRDGVGSRRYSMAQGQAFLYRYYGVRTESKTARHLQEAEYNMARAWHLIGMTHLAVPAYEKVLGLSERVQHEAEGAGGVEDFAQEAALALRCIYIAAGNQDAARAVTEKWLTL